MNQSTAAQPSHGQCAECAKPVPAELWSRHRQLVHGDSQLFPTAKSRYPGETDSRQVVVAAARTKTPPPRPGPARPVPPETKSSKKTDGDSPTAVFGFGVVGLIVGLLAIGASILISNAWSTKAEMCRYAEAYGQGSSSSCVFYKFADGIEPALLVGGGVMAVIGGLVTLSGLGLGISSLFKSGR